MSLNPNFSLDVFLLVMGGWIFSLCLHEFSHALVAYLGGDTSVRDKGYLTFNPFRYTEPVNSLILPLLFILIGGLGLPGGAVYIERSRLRSRHWECAVALAGPLSNAILLAVLSIPFHAGLVGAGNRLWAGYAFLCQLQVMAIILNLLPLPPLDGFAAIAAYLRPSTRRWFYSQSQLFFLALFVVLWKVAPVGRAFAQAVAGMTALAGVPIDLAFKGYFLTRILG